MGLRYFTFLPPNTFVTCPILTSCLLQQHKNTQVDDAEVAAVAKAQRDLLADAPNLESAAATDASQPKLGPHDFEILRVVGQGAFGKVGKRG